MILKRRNKLINKQTIITRNEVICYMVKRRNKMDKYTSNEKSIRDGVEEKE